MTLRTAATNFNDSIDKLVELVRYFTDNRVAYSKPNYKEAGIRSELIDPFFVALGWDVGNTRHVSPHLKPVIVEPMQEVEGAQRAPDYAFCIERKTKFFTEAKKIAVSIKNDPRPAYQLRSYAWSATLPLSLLTDFEELSVYDCRFRPFDGDKVTTARINYYTFDQYPDRWREIWDVFSYEALLSGAFDAYAQAEKPKRGTSEVDDEFLKEIERWRNDLARNIAIRNPSLSIDEMNDAVQRTIDRIVFLRIAEDRGIESYGQLQGVAQQDGIYPELVRLFRLADARYNSGLFNFSHTGDQLTPRLNVDDKLLRGILNDLYFPHSPYRFNVMPVEILGNVYEQFLGKVIRLTAAHQAKVEEKPEVKKAGGVYYTPAYIVDYIVKHTVGQKVADKDPRQIADLRVLDMACGSGSFLLGAYDFLLDYYLQWYAAHDPEKRKTLWRKDSDSAWQLTLDEKKRILTAHIYGVDIDRQAVEVTKLSLLLKVLEGESDATLSPQLPGMAERVLPNLDANIKCGNSLIGNDYFAGQLTPDVDDMRRVNAFDWEAEFPDIIRCGGFDCVIGNPPYIRIQTMKEWAPLEVEIYKEQYKAAGSGNYDIYVVFVEKGLSLLNKQGRLGFILPHKFFNSKYGEALRGLISQGKHLSHVVHFGAQQVFAGATTYTCLMFLDKAGSDDCQIARVNNLAEWRNTGTAIKGVIPSVNIAASEWNFTVGKGAVLFEKLSQMPVKMGDAADIFVGLQTSADDVFIMDLVEETSKTLRLKSQSLDSELAFEKGLLFPIVSGTDVNRYRALPERQYILFPYKVENESVELVNFDTLSSNYPKIADYLLRNKKRLEDRERGKMRGKRWYGYIYLKNMSRQAIEKLCVPRLVDKLYAAYDIEGNHYLDNVDVGGITWKPELQQQGLVYLLGLLNSELLRWYFPFVSAPFRGGWMSANRQFLSQLPIRMIDFEEPTDIARHDRMVSLVTQMLELHKRLPAARTDHDRQLVQRQIDSTDRQIDTLVYELYGLTDEEIEIVEGRN